MSEAARGAPDAKPSAEALCTSCGLCCDGSIFGRVKIEREDDFEQLGPVSPHRAPDGAAFFSQPCRALCGTRCAIYAARPSVCRSFRCKLLKSVERDPATLPAAMKTVATTSSLLQQLGPALVTSGYGDAKASRSAAMSAFRDAVLQATADKDVDFFQRHGPLVQLWLKASWIIHRHFHEKTAGRATSTSTQGGNGTPGQEEPGTLRSSVNG